MWIFQDHAYAFPPSPGDIADKYLLMQKKAEDLAKKLRNTKDRERRAKKTVCGLLEDLKGKNLLSQELLLKLDSYTGLKHYILPLLIQDEKLA